MTKRLILSLVTWLWLVSCVAPSDSDEVMIFNHPTSQVVQETSVVRTPTYRSTDEPFGQSTKLMTPSIITASATVNVSPALTLTSTLVSETGQDSTTMMIFQPKQQMVCPPMREITLNDLLENSTNRLFLKKTMPEDGKVFWIGTMTCRNQQEFKSIL